MSKMNRDPAAPGGDAAQPAPELSPKDAATQTMAMVYGSSLTDAELDYEDDYPFHARTSDDEDM
jgi:hypothetical protein